MHAGNAQVLPDTVHIPQIQTGSCQLGVLFNCQSAKVCRSVQPPTLQMYR